MTVLFIFFLNGVCDAFPGVPRLIRNQIRLQKRKITKETIMYNIALIQTLNSDWDFHHQPGLGTKNYETTRGTAKDSQENLRDSLKVKTKTFRNLGLKIVQDRTLCFAGRMLRGILMPKNRFLQTIIMRRIFLWYFPCIRVVKNAYRVNNRCFVKKEKKFLKSMKRVAATAWLKVKTMKLFYFE